MSDANAKVEKAGIKNDVTGTSGPGVRNNRGDDLIDFCKANRLVIRSATPVTNSIEDASTHGHHRMEALETKSTT